MTLYKIIGLNVEIVNGNSYETDILSNKIIHDKTHGKGITKHHAFTTYTMYVVSENAYYAIHLSEAHCASSRGRLCTIGDMSTTPSNCDEAMSKITHVPLTQVVFKLNNYYEDNVSVYVDDDPDTCVFKYSSDGDDERTPNGFVYVNMELFIPK